MKYILYLHIWLSIIAILLTYEASLFFSSTTINLNIVYFSGFATLFAYNAHTILAIYSNKKTSELTNWAKKNYYFVIVSTLIGLVGSIGVGFIGFAPREWMVLIISALLWFAYEIYIAKLNRKSLHVTTSRSFIKSIVLAMVWTIVTSILPLIVTRPIELMNTNAFLFMGIRFCLFAGITQLFEYRDLFDTGTKKQGVKKSFASNKVYNVSMVCCVFLLVAALQLTCIHAPVSFIVVTAMQLIIMLFFIRIKNIITITPSMIIWDGILILSPLINISLYYI